MFLSISNIAWSGDEEELYKMMGKFGFTGLEIAPTKVFGKDPYERLSEASEWAKDLKRAYGFTVPSIQSIWYGRREKLFRSDEEYAFLMQYTKKAIDLAAAIGCGNLVFGCPSARSIGSSADAEKGVLFFREIGGYAASKGTCIGMEANPPIYGTNYINDTQAAVELIREVDSKGFRLNLDMGTMIENGEAVGLIEGNVGYINHVHISEPGLCPIKKRELHREISGLLAACNYGGAVSIEMKPAEDLDGTERIMEYVREVFL